MHPFPYKSGCCSPSKILIICLPLKSETVEADGKRARERERGGGEANGKRAREREGGGRGKREESKREREGGGEKG